MHEGTNVNIKQILAATILAGAAAIGGAANANTLNFSFSVSGTVTNTLYTGDSGSGQFTLAGGTATLPAAITGITGQVNGAAITGLSLYAGADNLLQSLSVPYVDFAGVSFDAGGDSFNLYSIGNGNYELRASVDPGGNGSNGTPIDLTIGVPEPATWGLMIVGLGLAGAALRTRRWNAMAAA